VLVAFCHELLQVADLKDYVLLGKSAQQLAELAQQLGQPAYRGKQLLDGILRGAHSIEDIPGLPATFKQSLQDVGVKTGR
jgi:23S rRNA (adenine2503-C2)-methyltransferase